MTDATGRELTPAEEAEWQAMNADNEEANDKRTTPSEFVTERGDTMPTGLAKKFGRIWPSA